MKSFLIAFLVLFAATCYGATGDIVGASTTNGAGQVFYNPSAQLTLYVQGAGTNGTVATGFSNSVEVAGAFPFYATTNVAPHVRLSVTSKGFDRNGNATTFRRMIYGTVAGRFPYPNETNWNFTAAGGNAAVALWLSDYTYTNDTALTLSADSGVYATATVTNNSVSGLAVTNASVEDYPPIVGQWNWPDHQLASTKWTNHFMGFQSWAFDFQPAAYAYDVATDAHGHSKTNVATLIEDTVYTVGFPVPEYQTIHDASDFTPGDVVTNVFYMCPWLGTNIFVSKPNYTLIDTAGTFSIVVVVSTNGNNGTAIATNVANVAAARLLPAQDVPTAVKIISTYNNTHNGVYSPQGGLVLVQGGSYLAFPNPSDSGTLGAENAYVTVEPDTGFTRDQVIFTNRFSLDAIPNTTLLKFYNVTFNQVANYVMFYSSGAANVWLDNCIVNGYGPTSMAGGVGFTWGSVSVLFTRTTIHNNGTQQGIGGGGTIFRGNYADQFYSSSGGVGLDFVGNRISITNTFANDFFFSEIGDSSILYNNGFYNASGVIMGIIGPTTNGIAIVQNVMERIAGGSAQPLMALGALASGNLHNVIIAKNTMVGDRANLFYYNTGDTPNWYYQISQKDNALDGTAWKTDTFIANGNQVGNWAYGYEVGCANNVIGYYAGNSFCYDFIGLNTMFLGLPNDHTNNSYLKFQNDQSEFGGNGGNGDYNLMPTSPALSVTSAWNGLPWDIVGAARGISDPPGAYSNSNPKKESILVGF